MLCQFMMLGYRDFSLCRASSMVNCQSTPFCLSLLAIAQAPVSSRSISIFGMRRPDRHWRVIELNSFSAIFNQLPCFGVKRNYRQMRSGPLCIGRIRSCGYLRQWMCGRLWPSTVMGRRSYRNTKQLMRETVNNGIYGHRSLITTDGIQYYTPVIRRIFGLTCVSMGR